MELMVMVLLCILTKSVRRLCVITDPPELTEERGSECERDRQRKWSKVCSWEEARKTN